MTTKLFNSLAAATTLAGVLATAGAANAASLSYTNSASVAMQETDIINAPLSVQKFDSSLGNLTSVILNFSTNVTGDAGFENRGNGQANVTVNLGANISLGTDNGLDLTGISPLSPSVSQFYTVSGFDGVNDFNGTSGKSITGLVASDSSSKTFTDANDLAKFIGAGNLNFLFNATANSNVTGSGNMASFINTLAGANLSITYNYEASQAVPEPTAALGLGLFAGIGLLSQRKKSWLKISNS
ncbi:MAG: choice-of-anchor E domain-containing protein [Nodularia sp. (in: Bacteria)]|nr:MAG: choice-of-anchor E domain-containing protein [Nodularia sp. (in: cyanobacteria)]